MMGKRFIHPADQAVMEKILGAPQVKKWLDNVYADSLDETCQYVYSASCVKLEEPRLQEAIKRACDRFQVSREKISLYACRKYDYDVTLMGCDHVIILVPMSLLEMGDWEIIAGRIEAAVGEIAAGHAPLAFLTWAAENVLGSLPVPFVTEAFMALINEWKRVRVYTADRAFYEACGDESLSLRNILFGVVPAPVLERMHTGDSGDLFMPQVEEFDRGLDVAGKVGKVLTNLFQDYAWLPKRYQELIAYVRRRKGVR